MKQEAVGAVIDVGEGGLDIGMGRVGGIGGIDILAVEAVNEDEMAAAVGVSEAMTDAADEVSALGDGFESFLERDLGAAFMGEKKFSRTFGVNALTGCYGQFSG